jgi:hypothetical protein
MKSLVSRLAIIGLTFLSLVTQKGETYQFSPTTLQTRHVKTYYVRGIHVPIYRKASQAKEYMLCSLWRKLRVFPKRMSTDARWVNSLHCVPGSQSVQGPAYALLDMRTVGSPQYWTHFANTYPREAKKLFRLVISLLKAGNIDRATVLLAENAWLRIPV